jgi:hypothetical protein
MPDQISVEVEGANRVANWLRGLARLLPKAVDEETQEWGEWAEGQLRAKPYPPQRSGSKYQRTGDLGRMWEVKPITEGVLNITNLAQRRGRYYGGYVVGDGEGKGQAGIHQGRWWLLKKFADRALFPKLRERIFKRIDKETRI